MTQRRRASPRPSPPIGRLAVILALTAAAGGESTAAADEEPAARSPSPPSKAQDEPDLFICTLAAMPSCRWSLVLELGGGPGVAHSGEGGAESLVPTRSRFLAHMFVVAGALRSLPGALDVHVGPVFELAAEVNTIRTGWTASPNLRLRWFPLRTEGGGRGLALEGALGPQLQHFSYQAPVSQLGAGSRVGGMAELAVGYRGIVGAWTQASVLADPFDGHGSEYRFFAGVRFNLFALAIGIEGTKTSGPPFESPPPAR